MVFRICVIKKVIAANSVVPVLLILLLFQSISLVACQSTETYSIPDKWVIADLRIFSPDFSEHPNQDIIAAYTRETRSDIQIRLDFLDISDNNKPDIYIALDTQPGGTNDLPLEIKSNIEWDTLILIPADGIPGAYLPPIRGRQLDISQLRANVIPRIAYDPWNDYAIISLNKFGFPEQNQLFKAQVFLTDEGNTQPLDIIGPFQFDDNVKIQAPVLIAFWNVFPSYTPAQAIRRWDGAHTGPYGERHGLNLLLESVKTNKIPITLLDLRAPQAISAIDYIDQLSEIQKLVADRLILLPDPLPDLKFFRDGNSYINLDLTETKSGFNQSQQPKWLLECAQIDAREVSQKFHLPMSKFLYMPQLSDLPVNGYHTIFSFSRQKTSPRRLFETNVILIPSENHELQATPQGLSLSTRKELLKNIRAGTHGTSDFFFLGGSLPETTWGDPESVNAALRYIAEHPWIKPLNADELTAMQLNSEETSVPHRIPQIKTSPIPQHQDLINLICSDEDDLLINPILAAAWQSYQSMFSPLPPEPEMLQNLRFNYLYQIEYLLDAAEWAEHPTTQVDCSNDKNRDGYTECVLSSDNFYALFDRSGARLKFMFVRLSHEMGFNPTVHQIIGPTSQFLVGIGDPSSWNLHTGDASESEGVHGAFSDTRYSWDIYSITEISPGYISFTSPDGILSKSFNFDENRLTVEYKNTPPITVQIPLALDPWIRFTPDWGIRYWENQTTNGWIWGLHDGPQINITSNGIIELHPFTATQDNLAFRENPNFEYPPGHFLPFPIALTEIQSLSETLTIQLEFR